MQVLIKVNEELIPIAQVRTYSDLESVNRTLKTLIAVQLQTRSSNQVSHVSSQTGNDMGNSEPDKEVAQYDASQESLEELLAIYNEAATGKKTVLQLGGQTVTGNMAASLEAIASRDGPVRSPAVIVDHLCDHWRVDLRAVDEVAARNQIRTLTKAGFLSDDGHLTEEGKFVVAKLRVIEAERQRQIEISSMGDLPF